MHVALLYSLLHLQYLRMGSWPYASSTRSNYRRRRWVLPPGDKQTSSRLGLLGQRRVLLFGNSWSFRSWPSEDYHWLGSASESLSKPAWLHGINSWGSCWFFLDADPILLQRPGLSRVSGKDEARSVWRTWHLADPLASERFRLGT